MCCKSTEMGPPQRRQQVKVVEWLFINIFVYTFVCLCARYVYNMNVFMHIKLIVPRPHCANTKETKSTSISRSQRLFQVHGNWSRFGANLWTRRWLSSIPHKLKPLAAVSFCFCLNNCHRSNISAGICMHIYVCVCYVPVCEFSFRFEFLLGRDTVNTFLTLFMQLKINYVFFYTTYTIVYLPCVRVCVSPSSVKTDPGN